MLENLETRKTVKFRLPIFPQKGDKIFSEFVFLNLILFAIKTVVLKLGFSNFTNCFRFL
jgi:hypothetical protein